ncbi:TetR/AcrR family transcriptional regulator [Microbacterium sp. F2E]|uniref:TetR/AcrR family transcriptional regulator n=1 Tax=Microbacterium sp. F2E TaxID=2895284 RepID=UPI001E4D0953|nr:TetR/AcrR family transcriptional regulator [Microbacterium sp. F2E]MCC9053427.1 TetR/AcrR family transcriptional regulator [Microbacterium sp. F2E]
MAMHPVETPRETPPEASTTPSEATTGRGLAKAKRQDALLREAARLFAAQGFDGVSLEDLGAAVGISGPAVYRHFASKRALLGAILVRTSEELLSGGLRVVEDGVDASDQLRDLIDFHVDFAVSSADVIRVHDRDLARLDDDDRHRVRRLQREYVDVWTSVLARLHPTRPARDLRLRAHAGFGLINSTPYSVRALRDAPSEADVHDILADMAFAALSAD